MIGLGSTALGATRVAILIATLVSLSPAAALAAFPGGNGRIAYSGYPPGGGPGVGIHTILPDGSGDTELTSDGTQPSWSADGARIVFTRAIGDESHIFTMDAEGGNQTQLTHDAAHHGGPSFSPDGRRIVYGRSRGGGRPSKGSIVTILADGTDARRLVAGEVGSPEYSPSGKRIVFTGKPKDRRKDGIWTMRRNGSRLHRLTDPAEEGSYDSAPDFRPDGRTIVFLRCSLASIHGCSGLLHVVRADGAHERALPLAPGFNLANPPAFAPAGDRIILAEQVVELSCAELFTISPTGSDPQLVTHNCPGLSEPSIVQTPTWQPLPAG